MLRLLWVVCSLVVASLWATRRFLNRLVFSQGWQGKSRLFVRRLCSVCSLVPPTIKKRFTAVNFWFYPLSTVLIKTTTK